jgi:hypothetical protein
MKYCLILGVDHYAQNDGFTSLVEIFKYMIKYMISIPVIKDICEFINDGLIIVFYYYYYK